MSVYFIKWRFYFILRLGTSQIPGFSSAFLSKMTSFHRPWISFVGLIETAYPKDLLGIKGAHDLIAKQVQGKMIIRSKETIPEWL